MADQNIKNLEDLQDEYDFKVNTLKNRGEEKVEAGGLIAQGLRWQCSQSDRFMFLQRMK